MKLMEEEDFRENHRITLIYDDHRSSAVNRRRKTNSGGGGEAWETLNCGIEKVEAVLDQNNALIRQVKENQQSKVPENLVKNVELINEINRNISKVVSIYADISSNFTSIVRQRKSMSNKEEHLRE